MKRKTWLILAACLVAVGSLIFGGMMMALNWDFTKLDTTEYITNEHRIAADFQDISVDTIAADLTLLPSPDGTVSVVCFEQVKCAHRVAVENGALVIACNDTRQWYDHIGVHCNTPKITVYLPLAEYGKLSIHSTTGDIQIADAFRFSAVDMDLTTGDIRVENASVGSLSLSVTTGKVVASNITCAGDVNISVTTGGAKLANIVCGNVMSTGGTGDLTMQNVVATGKFSLKRTTGDIRFDGCDAGELSVKTTTGSVTGTLLTEKVFLASATTGDVDVPQTVTGGKCEIRTNTGDIRIQLP